MEGRKLSLTPYPELIIMPFAKKRARSFPKASIYTKQEITLFFVFASVGFYLIGFFLSAIFGSFVSPFDVFLTTPVISMSGYVDFFGTSLPAVNSNAIAGISGYTYIISLIVSGLVLLLVDRKIPELKEASVFSLIKITRAVMIYCLAFLIDTLVMITMTIVYRNLPLDALSVPILSSAVPIILFSLALNFLIYFIISDITDELLIIVLSMMIISLLQSFTSLPIGFPMFLLLSVVTLWVKKRLQESGVSDGICQRIVYWCYTPQGIWRLTLGSIVFICGLLGLRQRNSRD